MIILYIICALIVGAGLGIAIVAKRVSTIVDLERRSCAASKKRLEDENKRLCSENEELHRQLKASR